MTDVNPLLNVDALLDFIEKIGLDKERNLCRGCGGYVALETHAPDCVYIGILTAWGRRLAPEATKPENEAQIASQGDSEPSGDGCEHRRVRGLSSEDPSVRNWLAGKGKL